MSQTKTTKDDNQVKKEITLGGIVYILEGTVDIKITPKEGAGPVPDPDNPVVVEKPEDFGTIKGGSRWTQNPGKAETWKIVNMDNPPEKFKIVATDGLNVIADLDSKEQALSLVKYFTTNVYPPKGNDASTPEEPEGPAEPGQPGDSDAPYKTTGKTVEMSQRGPTKRNYASGKPSDWTIEKRAEKIDFDNIQAVFTVEIPKEWEHDDNLSVKLGGTHMGTGWFDHGISIYEGQSCLGKEEDHPSTQLCVIKGKKYGDIRGKTVSVAGTYFKKENRTEFWVKVPGVGGTSTETGWDKACEGVDVGGFNPKADESEVQLRIDGFKEKDKPPKITVFFVNEIAV